jgi:hypothetical protein
MLRLSGDERKVHEDIIQRRITGGVKIPEEVVREAYFRALKQWQHLPGSVVRPTTDVMPPIQNDREFQDLLSFRQREADTDNGKQSG